MTRDSISRGRRLFLIEAAITGAMTAIISPDNSPFMTGFALALGASDFLIGLLSTATMVGALGQLTTNTLIERIGSRRHTCLIALGVARLLRGGIILLPFLFPPLRMGAFVVLIVITAFFGSIGFVSRISWMADLVPQEIRGRFFGARIRAITIPSMLIGVTAGWALDGWKSAYPGREIPGFQVLLAAGTLIGLTALLALRRIPEPPLARSAQPLPFLQTLRFPFEHRPFRRLITFNLVWSFAVEFAAPFFVVYMIKQLGVDYIYITIFTAMGELASMTCSGFWGRLADRFGNKPVLTICATCKAIFPILWVFVTPGSYILLGLVHLVRAFNSGQEITTLNLVLKLSPDENRAIYISSHRVLLNLFGAISPAVGGGLATLMSETRVPLGFLTLYGLHFLFLLSGISRLIALFFLHRVPEPDARRVGEVIRTLRPVTAEE
jgi:MFS family permease